MLHLSETSFPNKNKRIPVYRGILKSKLNGNLFRFLLYFTICLNIKAATGDKVFLFVCLQLLSKTIHVYIE